MNVAWVERTLWAGAAAALALGVSGVRGGGKSGAPDVALAVVPRLALTMPTSDSLLDAAGVARELDLFRPDRAAVDHAATASGTPLPMGATAPAIRPQLVLRGLVGGPSLEALVEGVPGVEGSTVIRVGETIAGITLRAVRRDTAILVAKDTTWKLTVRRF